MRAFREREYACDSPLTPGRVLMELHGDRVPELKRQDGAAVKETAVPTLAD